MIEYFEKYYRLLNRASSSLASPFLLAVRLYWGWQFMQTGWGKLTDIGKVIHFFTDLGIPAPVLNAYFVSALEFGGGLLLLARARLATHCTAPRHRHGRRLHYGGS